MFPRHIEFYRWRGFAKYELKQHEAPLWIITRQFVYILMIDDLTISVDSRTLTKTI